MRKHFLTTVAIMAIATPALAADLDQEARFAEDNFTPAISGGGLAGDIELSIGWNWLEDDKGNELDFNTFQGWGRANIPVGGTWNILVEAGGTAAFGGDFEDGSSNASYGGNAHVWAGMNNLRLGAFGGVSFGESAPNILDSNTFGQVGLEAEVDFGNATVGVQGFYSWLTGDCPSGDCDLYGASAWLDYYITPNTKVTATGQWWQTRDIVCGVCGTDTYDTYGGTARITHRFAGTPLNIFGEVGYWTNSDAPGPRGDHEVVSVLGGLTIILDQGGTQQDYDRQVPFTFRNPVSRLLVGG